MKLPISKLLKYVAIIVLIYILLPLIPVLIGIYLIYKLIIYKELFGKKLPLLKTIPIIIIFSLFLTGLIVQFYDGVTNLTKDEIDFKLEQSETNTTTSTENTKSQKIAGISVTSSSSSNRTILISAQTSSIISKNTSSSVSTVKSASIDDNFYLAKVTRVIDGDTIEIEGGESVRYIGIDTPELKSSDCYSVEARNKNKELVLDRIVKLEFDKSKRDKYQRLLRYVWIDDKLINEILVSEGFAESSMYEPDTKYQNRFDQAQQNAKSSGKGKWSACNVSAVSNSSTSISSSSSAHTPTPTPTPAPATNYTCNCKKTCPNMNCEEAQFQLNSCGCSARDADKDGIACDTQCQ
jgi:micrococcal nuclease